PGIEAIRHQVELDTLAGENRLDRLDEAARENQWPEALCELAEPGAYLDVLDEVGDRFIERRADRRHLRLHQLAVRERAAERVLRRAPHVAVAEALEQHPLRVANGDGAVPVEHEPHGRRG